MEIDAPSSGFEVLKHTKHRSIKFNSAIKPLFQTKLARQLSIKNLHGDITQQPHQGYRYQATEVTEPSQVYESKELDVRRRRSPSVESYVKRMSNYKPELLKKTDIRPRAVSRLRNPIDAQSISVLNFKNQDLGYHVDISRNLSRFETLGDLPYENEHTKSFERVRMRPGLYRPLLRTRAPETNFTLDASIQSVNQPEQLNKSSIEKLKVPNPPLPRINKTLTPKDFVFAPNVPDHIVKKHALEVIEGVKYALERVNTPSVSQIMPRMISLRRRESTNRKTLVLDLDETLITTKLRSEGDGELPPIRGGNLNSQLTVRIRPYAEEFLREMSKEFEIVIFTAAEQKYAESIIKILDPNRLYVSHILHRENCLKTRKGLFIKDLRLIKNRDLKDMVIVDNFVHSFSFQIENGIPIITWEGDQKDQELKYLMDYLKEAKKYDDMRQFNKERLRLAELLEISPEKFLNL